MRSLLSGLTALCTLTTSTQALYFYLDGTTPKCFYEELPKDTLVVGSYKAEAYNPSTGSFAPTNELSIAVTVDETFDNDHRVVNQRTTSSETRSKFTFSSAEAGDHRICFTPSGPAAISVGGWLGGNAGVTSGGVRLSLDMAIGETSKIQSADQGKVDSIVAKVKELNGRLADIRREQIFQRVSDHFLKAAAAGWAVVQPTASIAWTADMFRDVQEREAEFRDQSESTNAKIVRWTLIQLAVLGITCAWQLSHLRSFFIKQKLT
jgi:p24 family protein alpha